MIYFQLFYVFFLIGLFTFGGGYAMIPMIQSEVVTRGWISEATLTDFIAISEVTPGPFAVNIATFIGSEMGGILGSVCATIGLVLPSFIIVLLIAIILKKFITSKYVQAALNGVKPIIISLILSTVIFLFIKIIFFNGHSLNSSFYFDRASLALLLVLFIISFLYKKKNKKKLSPIA
ncbi:MAG: chromate transporter, partial [Bacilli bacterium]